MRPAESKDNPSRPMASLAQSVAGQSFIQTARIDAWRFSVKVAWWVLLLFNTVSLIGQYVAGSSKIADVLLYFHVITYLWLAWGWWRDFFPKWQFIFWPLFSCFMIACHLEVVRLDILTYEVIRLENAGVALLLILVSTMLCPGPLYYAVAVGVFSVAWSYVSFADYEFHLAYVALAFGGVLGGCVWNALVLRIVEQMAASSLAMRVTMAPAHVAKQAIDHSGVAEGFPVAERSTAVAVIKWSELAAKSHDLTPIELDKLLSAYFGLVDHLLSQHLPSGAWYVDVIQHEIHVYIFNDLTQLTPEKDAVIFAKMLMTERAKNREFDSMGHLDIGISSGPVVTGIVGPKIYQKTAAIGPATGVAIAAKSLGVPLRNALGGADRILMDASIAQCLADTFGVKSIFAPPIFSGRRWNDDFIFVIESESDVTSVPVGGGV